MPFDEEIIDINIEPVHQKVCFINIEPVHQIMNRPKTLIFKNLKKEEEMNGIY